MKTYSTNSALPITQLDGTIIRLDKSGHECVLYVRIGARETSRIVRFWMGMKGALPVTQAVEDMKNELLNAQEKARLAFVSTARTRVPT
jgi:hypothetical protein